MPTRKQRRRQQKLRRHEYEEVYVDAEGNVLDAGDVPEEPAAAVSRNGRARRDRPRASQRNARAMQQPSWRRVLKRGAIFAPIMFILVSLLAGDQLSVAGRIVQTLFLVLIFLPFSYLMDSLTYRIWRKRTGAG